MIKEWGDFLILFTFLYILPFPFLYKQNTTTRSFEQSRLISSPSGRPSYFSNQKVSGNGFLLHGCIRDSGVTLDMFYVEGIPETRNINPIALP